MFSSQKTKHSRPLTSPSIGPSIVDIYNTVPNRRVSRFGLFGTKRNFSDSNQLDRFIPNRRFMNELDISLDEGCVSKQTPGLGDASNISTLLLDNLFGMTPEQYRARRVLHFSPPAELEKQMSPRSKPTRLANAPFSLSQYQVLDAPGVLNDFYSNLVCWTSDEKVVIALDDTIYHYDIRTCRIGQSVSIDEKIACSVIAMQAQRVASGWSDGYIRVHSLMPSEGPVSFHGDYRVGGDPICSMASMDNETLVCGDKVGQLSLVDFRTNQGVTCTVKYASQTIAGIAYDGVYSIAVGSNDNAVRISDIRRLDSELIASHTEHQACVKGIAFRPGSQRYVVSGGGGGCRKLCLYDIQRKEVVNMIDTGGQVTGVHWLASSPRYFATSHGYSDCGVRVWGFDKSNKITLKAHHSIAKPESAYRVLSIAGSSVSNQFVALTSDETARFFSPSGVEMPQSVKSNKSFTPEMLSSFPMVIR